MHTIFLLAFLSFFYITLQNIIIEKQITVTPGTAIKIDKTELISKSCQKSEMVNISIELKSQTDFYLILLNNEYIPKSEYKSHCQIIKKFTKIDFSATNIFENEFESIMMILDNDRYCGNISKNQNIIEKNNDKNLKTRNIIIDAEIKLSFVNQPLNNIYWIYSKLNRYYLINDKFHSWNIVDISKI